MKKIILFLLLIIMVFSSTSFAQERIDREGRQQKAAAISAAKIIAEDRATIKTLSEEVRDKTKQVKLRIKVLLENDEELSTEQLKALKNSIILIKRSQESMRNTPDQINAYNDDVLVARQAKDFDALLKLYKKINSIQKNRIYQLTQFNKILDDLLNTL